ncbi:MAG: LemA family protein [Chloroflexi bacterium]|nr:LemA family protein [Chloroflexota bacterium]MBI4503905.1 LemA family protein [Chloroflexota bacterium]
MTEIPFVGPIAGPYAVPIAVGVVLLLWFVLTYNGLIQLRMQVRNAWSQIDVQLKRRHDLIPNLVATVQGYAAHERGTFEQVTLARQRAVEARGAAEAGRAEGLLTRALGGLFAVAEAYPELKANTNFLALQEELAGTENRIGFARQFYTDQVMALNTRIESVPSNVVAAIGGFRRAEFFEIEEAGEREVPQVRFA